MKLGWLALLALLAVQDRSWAGTPLFFHVSGVRKDGILHAGLFRRTDPFLKAGGEFLRAATNARALETAVIGWDDVPFGTYALALYLDVNRNGRADRGLLGIPLEPFGFYRHMKVLIGAPRFEDCAFQVMAASNVFQATLQEWGK